MNQPPLTKEESDILVAHGLHPMEDPVRRGFGGACVNARSVAELLVEKPDLGRSATIDFETIEKEMMDWLVGARTWTNLGQHPPYTPDVIAVMDAQEVVKRAAVLALRGR